MKPERLLKFTCATALSAFVSIAGATNSPESDDPNATHDDGSLLSLNHHRTDPNAAMIQHDAATAGVVSTARSAKVTKNLAPAGRGERLLANATTDVWVLGDYAYTGTFSAPCGGDFFDPDEPEKEAGIHIWDVKNKNKVSFVGVIPSPVGSRSNDVRAASMNSGDILVHSNESCGGGPGGFEIYNVDDPTNPVLLNGVQTDDVNLFLQDNFGYTEVGVHNLWLFSQGANDYVAATVESEFGNFQIFDITDPANPTLVGFWGAEQLFPTVTEIDWVNLDDFGVILDVDEYLFAGFGSSQNKFLHDVTISADGTRAYLASWDAGLILLDITNPAIPTLVSVAIDPVNGSLDGEVNSHSVWPSADGNIVVEGEEDFSAWEATIPPGNVTFANGNPIPGVMAATTTGDAFEGSQTGNAGFITATRVEITSGPLIDSVFGASEFSGNSFPLGTGSVVGDFVWIGQGCDLDAILNPVAISGGGIAVVRRGACSFAEKSVNASNAGADAIVVTNNNPNSTPWSGLRIWDYSDQSNPVLASIFDTECSASTAPGGNCDPRGTYSSHNVYVESKGNTVKAYISWYNDGVVVVDVTDPYNPVETARYHRAGDPFEAENGGIQDIWGIYKEPNSPWIYASDRNGGLYILKEYGAGSAKNGKK